MEQRAVVTDPLQFVEVARSKGGVLADEMGLGKTMESKHYKFMRSSR
jgi:SNF2 family DNA or RNA helicase